MMMTETATPAGLKTLYTVHARGGEMNTYAGQPGFHANSVAKLVRDGHLAEVPNCGACQGEAIYEAAHQCERPLAGQGGGHRCYGRVRITDAGLAAIGAARTE